MTRKEAIRWLKDFKNCSWDGMPEEALDIAIKALEQEPTSPCDVCRYNPPSSTDGKPCTMCPAESEDKE